MKFNFNILASLKYFYIVHARFFRSVASIQFFPPLTFWHLLFSSPWLKNRGSRNSEMTGNSAFLQHSKNAADISYSCFSFSKTRKLFETEADMFPGFVICQINWNRYLEQNKTILLQKLFGVAARKFTQWLFCAHTYFLTLGKPGSRGNRLISRKPNSSNEKSWSVFV